jgi:hypothetical protein
MNSANVPVFHRRLDFQVLGLDQNHLRVLATLEDMMHHFILTVDVRVPEMLIASATLEIPRYPNRRCRLIRPAVDQLVGLKIERGFTDRAAPTSSTSWSTPAPSPSTPPAPCPTSSPEQTSPTPAKK